MTFSTPNVLSVFCMFYSGCGLAHVCRSLVQVCRIIDKNHRAYKTDKRGKPNGFAAVAAKDIAAYTVLGTYGGITARTSDLDEDTALVESGENYAFNLDLTAEYDMTALLLICLWLL